MADNNVNSVKQAIESIGLDEIIAENLVFFLKEQRVFYANGGTYPEREKSVEYLLCVLPKLPIEELEVLKTRDKLCVFYQRFVFNPGKGKNTSLMAFLKQKKALDEFYSETPNFNLCFDLCRFFEMFDERFGISRWEKVEKSYLDDLWADFCEACVGCLELRMEISGFNHNRVLIVPYFK